LYGLVASAVGMVLGSLSGGGGAATAGGEQAA